MRILFIGDIVGRPGPRAGPNRACRRWSTTTPSTWSSPTPKTRPPAWHHPRDRRRAARLGRRRDDLGQSHLGQEGSARLHRRRVPPAAAGQLPRRRAGQRQLSGADSRMARPVGVINVMGRVFMQRLDDPFAVVSRKSKRCGPGPRHLRGLPRRSHVGENRDGMASRRQGHRRHRHPHPRAVGRRSDPAGGTAYLTDAGMTGPHDSRHRRQTKRGDRSISNRDACADGNRHRATPD